MFRSINLLLCFTVFLWKEAVPNEAVPSYLHFPMDDKNGDTLIGDRPGRMYNYPRLSSGVHGKALHVNNNYFRDQWVDLGLTPCFSDLSLCTDGYTLSVWLRLDPYMWTPGDRYILSSGGQSYAVGTGGIAVWMYDGNLRVEVRLRTSPPGQWLMSLPNRNNNKFQPNQWFLLTVIWRPHGQIAAYVNGKFIVRYWRTTYTANGRIASRMYIGRPNNADNIAEYGRFAIDEMQYWDHVLTENQILRDYRQGPPKYSFIKHDRSELCLTTDGKKATLEICDRRIEQQWYWVRNHIMSRKWPDEGLYCNKNDFWDQRSKRDKQDGRTLCQICLGETNPIEPPHKWKYENGYLQNYWTTVTHIGSVYFTAVNMSMVPYHNERRIHLANSGHEGNEVGARMRSRYTSSWKWSMEQVAERID